MYKHPTKAYLIASKGTFRTLKKNVPNILIGHCEVIKFDGPPRFLAVSMVIRAPSQ